MKTVTTKEIYTSRMSDLLVPPKAELKFPQVNFKNLANSRLKAQGLQQGREGGEGELGVVVWQVRRMLSIAAVRAQAEFLLSRLRHVGGGAGAAYSRRQGAVRKEENWARERQAQAVGRRQGSKVVKRGMFLLK